MDLKHSTIWTSHRGYCENAVENTLASFDQAKKLGFYSFETDLRMTKDHHIVLSHDMSFVRLGGPPTPISELTRKQIESISLHYNCKPLFWDEFVDRYAGFSWTFDIKPESAHLIINYLKTWTEEKNTSDWLTANARFLFWNQSHEIVFKSYFPKAICLAQEFECWRAGISALLNIKATSGIRHSRTYSITPKLTCFNTVTVSTLKPRIVDFYHSQGARLLAFLPKDTDEAKAALRLKFDEILTDGKILI
ncbi:MAG: glycerophosphodiester phosphodiesterase family protein [Bdellovibrionota bacterium]